MTTNQLADITQGDADLELADFMATCVNDPLRHVMASYPWGEPGTPLADRDGPSDWQREFLIDLGERVKANKFTGREPVPPLTFSTSSGHGIGKSCLCAWLIIWIRDTRPQSFGTITATTAEQLRSRTFAEVSKWNDMSLTKHWFQLNAGSAGSLNMYHKDDRTWGCSGQTCQENNSEAFAGQHRDTSTSYYIFDEASGVPDKIFEVRAGGLVRGEAMSFDFGNPTRNSGRFYENMMGRYKHRFIKRFIDSRDVAMTNKELFAEWERDYGSESSFFKVRVRGLFGDVSDMQFIPRSDVDKGIGLDVVVTPSGVVDRCRQLALDVVEINFGSKATQKGYANMRSQMWGNMRDALKDGVRLPDNDDLVSDLTTLEYGYNLRNDIQLEKKEDLKKRTGGNSPDLADALALTYCLPVAPTRAGYDGGQYTNTKHDYEPL